MTDPIDTPLRRMTNNPEPIGVDEEEDELDDEDADDELDDSNAGSDEE